MDCPCNRCDGEQKASRGRLFIVKGIVVAAPKPKKVQTTFEFGIKTVSSLTIRAHFHLRNPRLPGGLYTGAFPARSRHVILKVDIG